MLFLLATLCQLIQFKYIIIPELEEKANRVLTLHNVENSRLEIKYFNVYVGGIVESLEVRNEVITDLENVGGSSLLRVKEGNTRLLSGGVLKFEKINNRIVVRGEVRHKKSSLIALKKIGHLPVIVSDELTENSYISDSRLIKSPYFKSWLASYMLLDGDRSVTLYAKGNKVVIDGSMTESFYQGFMEQAREGQFELENVSEFITSSSSSILFRKTSGLITIEGMVPAPLNKKLFSYIDHDKTVVKPLQVLSPLLKSDVFIEWLKNYITTSGDRSLLVKGEKVFLKGEATELLSSVWYNRLQRIGVEVDISQLKHYPSWNHYPSYKSSYVSSVDGAVALKEKLRNLTILFSDSNYEVPSAELKKIDEIANEMKIFGTKLNYIIGGHWSGMESQQAERVVSRQRVISVIDALEARGVRRSLFRMVSFGKYTEKFDRENFLNSVEIRIK